MAWFTRAMCSAIYDLKSAVPFFRQLCLFQVLSETYLQFSSCLCHLYFIAIGVGNFAYSKFGYVVDWVFGLSQKNFMLAVFVTEEDVQAMFDQLWTCLRWIMWLRKQFCTDECVCLWFSEISRSNVFCFPCNDGPKCGSSFVLYLQQKGINFFNCFTVWRPAFHN